jgi:hypothetical protein
MELSGLTSHPGRFTHGKVPQYPLNRIGGPHSRSGRFGEEKNLLQVPEFEPWTVRYTDTKLNEPLPNKVV